MIQISTKYVVKCMVLFHIINIKIDDYDGDNMWDPHILYFHVQLNTLLKGKTNSV